MTLDLMDDMKAGIKEAKRGNTKIGIELLHSFAMHDRFPAAKAWFGYCLAYEQKDFPTGIAFCREALREDSQLSDGYLALGRIYLHQGRRKQAVDVLQQGTKTEQNNEILSLLKAIGIRRRLTIPFLSRDNFINISLGRLLASIGLR